MRKGKEDPRDQRRVPVDCEVRIQVHDWEPARGEQAINLSEGGIQIHTDSPLSPGTVFEIVFNLEEEEIQAKAQVIWTKEFSAKENRPSGMGARFLEMSSVHRKLLLAFMRQRLADTTDA